MATNLPAGWEYDAVFGAGQGATPGPVHLLLGVAALAGAALLRFWWRFRYALGVVRYRDAR
jgi:hypothetical protein